MHRMHTALQGCGLRAASRVWRVRSASQEQRKAQDPAVAGRRIGAARDRCMPPAAAGSHRLEAPNHSSRRPQAAGRSAAPGKGDLHCQQTAPDSVNKRTRRPPVHRPPLCAMHRLCVCSCRTSLPPRRRQHAPASASAGSPSRDCHVVLSSVSLSRCAVLRCHSRTAMTRAKRRGSRPGLPAVDPGGSGPLMAGVRRMEHGAGAQEHGAASVR